MLDQLIEARLHGRAKPEFALRPIVTTAHARKRNLKIFATTVWHLGNPLGVSSYVPHFVDDLVKHPRHLLG